MQDIIAIALAVAAAVWLGTTLWRRLWAPPCQGPADGPPGSDGFVPLDALSRPPDPRAGRPPRRPGGTPDDQYMS